MATPRSRKHSPRGGFSFLEVQVAFLLLSIALSGLVPLVVMQSRQLRQLESRFDDQTTYYLKPSSLPWPRKLGAAAKLQTTDPGRSSGSGSDSSGGRDLTILSFTRSLTSETVQVEVRAARGKDKKPKKDK